MDITKLLGEAIQKQLPDEPRQYIGASSIGRECSRAIWYEYHKMIGTDFSSKLKTTFKIGKLLEGMILDDVDLLGFELERPAEINNYLFCRDESMQIFQGHMDSILYLNRDNPVILEIKTCKNSSFNSFKKDGLKIWSQTYFAQLQAYMGMTDIHHACLLALNKDTSEYHHEWVDYDDIYYHELREKALIISSCETPPEQINRSPLYFVCAGCRFKTICHGNKEDE